MEGRTRYIISAANRKPCHRCLYGETGNSRKNNNPKTHHSLKEREQRVKCFSMTRFVATRILSIKSSIPDPNFLNGKFLIYRFSPRKISAMRINRWSADKKFFGSDWQKKDWIEKSHCANGVKRKQYCTRELKHSTEITEIMISTETLSLPEVKKIYHLKRFLS